MDRRCGFFMMSHFLISTMIALSYVSTQCFCSWWLDPHESPIRPRLAPRSFHQRFIANTSFPNADLSADVVEASVAAWSDITAKLEGKEYARSV